MMASATSANTTATEEAASDTARASNDDGSSEPPRPPANTSQSAEVDDDAESKREEPRRDLPAPANGGSLPPSGPTSTSTAAATDGTTTTTTMATTVTTMAKKKVQLSLVSGRKKKKSSTASTATKSLTTLDGVTESEAASDRRRREAEEAARRRREGEDAPLVIPLRSQNDGSLPSSSVANGENADAEAARALEREAEARGSGRGDDDGGGGTTNFSVNGGLVIGSSSAAGDDEPRPASQAERNGGENRGKNGKPLPLLLASRPAALNDPGSQNLDDDEKFRLDLDHRPAELEVSSDAYASVPIGEFGAALLRGMGWTGDTTTTENDKGGGEVKRPRHHRLGLGAAPRPVEIDPSTSSNRPGGKRHRARKPGEYERDRARAEAEDKERRRREALEAERRRRDLQETLQVGSVVLVMDDGGDGGDGNASSRAVVVKVGGVPGLNRILVRFEGGREPTAVRRGDARLVSQDELDRDPFRDGKEVNGERGGVVGGATKSSSRHDEDRLGGSRDRDMDGSTRRGWRGREERDSSRRHGGGGDDRGKDRSRGGSRSRSRERDRERSRKASRRREERGTYDDDDRRNGSGRHSSDRHRDRDRDQDRDQDGDRDRRDRKRRRREGDEPSRGGRERSWREDRHRRTGDRDSRDGRDRASHERRHDHHHWLIPHIRVRVITRKFDPRGGVDGRNRRTHSSSHYKRKGVVVDVTRAGECTIRMDGVGTLLEGVAERHLETAPPREGGEVVVLSLSSMTSASSSNHLHARGRLLEKDTDRNRCAVQLFDDMSVLTLSLDDVAEWCGPPDEAGG